MGQFIDGLYKLRDAREEGGTTVLVVHHTGYDTSRARAARPSRPASITSTTSSPGRRPAHFVHAEGHQAQGRAATG